VNPTNSSRNSKHRKAVSDQVHAIDAARVGPTLRRRLPDAREMRRRLRNCCGLPARWHAPRLGVGMSCHSSQTHANVGDCPGIRWDLGALAHASGWCVACRNPTPGRGAPRRLKSPRSSDRARVPPNPSPARKQFERWPALFVLDDPFAHHAKMIGC
jgi:hypothetical protein